MAALDCGNCKFVRDSFSIFLFYCSHSDRSALWAYALPAALGTVYVAPGFALIQNQTPTEMRSVAAAINLFIVNIIGLGLGPFSIGFFSDMFSPEYGLDGLRYALMTSLVVILWGSFHYYRTGVLLKTVGILTQVLALSRLVLEPGSQEVLISLRE